MVSKKVIGWLNVVFVFGWLLLFVDDPMRYPMDGKTFLTQFRHPAMWGFLLYLLVAEYVLFRALKHGASQAAHLLSSVVFLPFLYFTVEYLRTVSYCIVFFCGDVYPPTWLTYVSGAVVGAVPVATIVFLISRLLKNHPQGRRAD